MPKIHGHGDHDRVARIIEESNKRGKLVQFKASNLDGYWICLRCGVAVTPIVSEVNEHIVSCSQIEGSEK